MPTPPAVAIATNTMRTTSGSIPAWRASPEQTPAINRCSRSRRGPRRAERAGSPAPEAVLAIVTAMMTAALVLAGEPADEQDRAHDGAGDRRDRGEARVEHPRL